MKKSTLCYCLKDGQVLLAMKKRGFGAGKWNGYGGKVLEEETPKQAALRELQEESGIISTETDLHQVGLIRFYFDGKPIFKCHVFLVREWRNEPKETEEMRPQWYPLSQLPFGEMWAADARWLPFILKGVAIEAEVNFNADGSAVKAFHYKPGVFN